jgi:hypothetical protein
MIVVIDLTGATRLSQLKGKTAEILSWLDRIGETLQALDKLLIQGVFRMDRLIDDRIGDRRLEFNRIDALSFCLNGYIQALGLRIRRQSQQSSTEHFTKIFHTAFLSCSKGVQNVREGYPPLSLLQISPPRVSPG